MICSSGRATPGLAAAIDESFHIVISPAKMPATVVPSMFRLEMPSRLKITAIGEIQIGNSQGIVPASQLGKVLSSSSSFQYESEPVKEVAPSMN